jgi:iron complex transport system ATP-binding protein
MAQLTLENVQFEYSKEKNGQNHFNLMDINLSFNRGEFISLLGPNGSGKSTLLKIISGLLKPLSGRITLDDKSYSSIQVKDLAKKIAFVPQSSLTVFPFSVYEIVMMGRTPYLNYIGFETKEDKNIVEDALQLVGITHLKNHCINEVSGGEAQLAFIARAMVQKPEIILLDEPNSHLDIKHQITIFNLIKSQNIKNSLTVISVSHDLNLAGFYSDRIILIKNGRIFKDDITAQILTSENINAVFNVESVVAFNPEINKLNIIIKPDFELP